MEDVEFGVVLYIIDIFFPVEANFKASEALQKQSEMLAIASLGESSCTDLIKQSEKEEDGKQHG